MDFGKVFRKGTALFFHLPRSLPRVAILLRCYRINGVKIAVYLSALGIDALPSLLHLRLGFFEVLHTALGVIAAQPIQHTLQVLPHRLEGCGCCFNVLHGSFQTSKLL